MSKFLILVHDDSAAGTIDDWLQLRRSTSSEQWSTRLNSTYTLRIVSRDVADAVRGRSFFSGVAMSESSAFLTLDTAGWQRSERLRSRAVATAGAFVQATWSRSEVRIGNDLFGTVPIAQAHGPGFVAFSDSLLVLADLRDRFGLVNTPNAEALLARTGLSWRTAQVLSTETPVREIALVPPGRGVTVQCTRPLLVDADETSLGTVLESGPGAIEAARTSAAFLVSVLGGLPDKFPTSLLVSSPQEHFLLDVLRRSGSAERVAVRAAASSLDRLTLGQREQDIESAQPLPDDEALTSWAASSLGLYDGVAPSEPTPSLGDSTIGVDAAGNAVARRIWGSQSAEEMRQQSGLEGRAGDAYVAQVAKGLRSIGCDPVSQSSSQQHYVAYRSPRYVASVWAGSTTLHPLHSLSSATVSTIGRQLDGVDGLDAIEALLTERTGHGPDAVAGRAVHALTLAELGGPLQDSEVPELEIFGNVRSAQGSTELGLAIAAGRGLGGSTAERDVLAALMEDLLGVLPTELLPAFEPLLNNARWHLLDKREPFAEAGPSIGKLLSLVLFAN